jgi:hypothetical protein
LRSMNGEYPSATWPRMVASFMRKDRRSRQVAFQGVR